MTVRGPRVILAFPDEREPAQRFADCLSADLHVIAVHRFPDGESRLRLPPELPPEVVFYRSLHRPNGKLVELELAAAAAQELGARDLTLVAPYLCYMRQDAAFHPGEAVSQRIIGAFLARRFGTVVTVDPHLHRTHRLEDAVPARRALCVSAAPAMVSWLAERDPAPFLLGPDAESHQWVSAIAASTGLPFGIARKHRFGDRDVRIALPESDHWRGRDVVLIDDVASTGNTLAGAVEALAGHAVGRITALVTHALFVEDALARLHAVGVEEIVSTDSIPHETSRLPLAPLLARALA